LQTEPAIATPPTREVGKGSKKQSGSSASNRQKEKEQSEKKWEKLSRPKAEVPCENGPSAARSRKATLWPMGSKNRQVDRLTMRSGRPFGRKYGKRNMGVEEVYKTGVIILKGALNTHTSGVAPRGKEYWIS